jgi:hypothetical protein
MMQPAPESGRTSDLTPSTVVVDAVAFPLLLGDHGFQVVHVSRVSSFQRLHRERARE